MNSCSTIVRFGIVRFRTLAAVWRLVLLLSVWVAADRVDSAEAIRLPGTRDAWLEDTFFLDLEQGWSVGREGVIWHTPDGGEHWELQHAEPGVVFHKVFFLDRLHGWAVGGRVHPVSWRTSAVILRTSSGGRRWTRIDSPGLPELYGIHFFSVERGVAYGACSTIYPTGIVRTEDGGRSWIGMSGVPSGRWHDAIWRSPTEGTLIGSAGVAEIRAGKLRVAVHFDGEAQRLHKLTTGGDGAGQGSRWIVGDQGTLRRWTSDSRRWNPIESTLPPAFQTLPPGEAPPTPRLLAPDFHAVAQFGSHLWIAGSPGSFVLHSSDGGRSWEVQYTGVTVPLSDLQFVDEQTGWGVGALGTILHTRDGGKSWQVQHRGGERLALWGLHRSAERIPLPLFGYFSTQEGWLTGAILMSPVVEGQATRSSARLDRRLSASIGAVGGTISAVSPHFPIIEAGGVSSMADTLQAWQNRYGSGCELAWIEFLNWQLSQWRPEVVCFGNYSRDETDSLDRFIHRTLLQVGRRGSTRDPFSSRLQAWGLKPWRPQKIIELTPVGRRAAESMPITQLMPLAYSSVDAHAWPAQLLLASEPRPFPSRLGWRISQHSHLTQRDSRLLADGVQGPPSGTRRRMPQIALQLKRINYIAQTLRSLHEATAAPDLFFDRSDWPGRLQSMLQPLPPIQAGQAMFRLAIIADRSGNSTAAATIYRQLVQQFPTHPLREAALWQLIRYSGSREAAAVAAAIDPASPIAQATFATEELTGSPPLDPWKQLTDQIPDYLANPRVALSAAARLRATKPSEALTRWQAVANSALPPWSRLAKGEIWLIQQRGSNPVSTVHSRRATKPHLDGRLDETLWTQTEPIELATAGPFQTALPTSIRFAHDQRYLYFAVVCEKPRSRRHRGVVTREDRDQADTRLDHIVLEIDTERDYSTAFRLVVDSRGWVTDSYRGSTAWNPQWYVAAGETARQWTIECALPWQSIGTRPPTPKGPIGIHVKRTVPGLTELRWPEPKTAPWGWLVGPLPESTSAELVQ